MAASTSGVYVSVIKDVINKVREEFMNNGPGEDVLNELQGTWEAKTVQAGVVNNPIERSAAKGTPGSGVTPIHDLKVPYEGTEKYKTPTAEMLFPPTPLQTPIPATPIPTPLPGTGDNMYNIPTGGSEYSANESGSSNGGVNAELKAGRSGPYMQPPSTWMNHPSHDLNLRVRFMCSFGGKILPRPHDNQLRYVGGDTRIVVVHRTVSTLPPSLSPPRCYLFRSLRGSEADV
ncbi:hypothetical protein PS2_034708 [Malus domestica]